MVLLETYPVHHRKRIALICTAVVGAILVVLLFIVYTAKPVEDTTGTGEKIDSFYTTILQSAQSFFVKK